MALSNAISGRAGQLLLFCLVVVTISADRVISFLKNYTTTTEFVSKGNVVSKSPRVLPVADDSNNEENKEDTIIVDRIRNMIIGKEQPDEPTVVVSIAQENMWPFAGDFFSGKVCERVQGNFTNLASYNDHSTLVNVSFSCQELFHRGMVGSGNYIAAFYGLRMVAHALGTTDVSIQCSDAEEVKKKLILPWVMGVFPRLKAAERTTKELPTLEQACEDYKSVPIGYRWKDMQFEMRRMAIAMVGIPSPDHPSAAWAEKNLWAMKGSTHRRGRDYYQLANPQKGDTPFFPGTELDDAMLHFRCGDLANTNHPSFGFMKFGSFSRHLSPDVRSIGIATQPFVKEGQRGDDSGPVKMRRCEKIVTAFVEHLQEKFPKARIRIHNGLSETLALTFARMVMANQTVIAISSFGVLPGVGTFGTGYIREPDFIKAPNRWLLTSPLVKRAGNVHLIKEPVLMARHMKLAWQQGTNDGSEVIEWMRNYSKPAPTLIGKEIFWTERRVR